MSTILLAHSHPAVRAWVRSALSHAQGIAFIAEASSDREVASLTAQVRWDVALVSYSLLENLPLKAKASHSTAESSARPLVLGTPARTASSTACGGRVRWVA